MKESSAWALKLLIPPQEMYVESDGEKVQTYNLNYGMPWLCL